MELVSEKLYNLYNRGKEITDLENELITVREKIKEL